MDLRAINNDLPNAKEHGRNMIRKLVRKKYGEEVDSEEAKNQNQKHSMKTLLKKKQTNKKKKDEAICILCECSWVNSAKDTFNKQVATTSFPPITLSLPNGLMNEAAVVGERDDMTGLSNLDFHSPKPRLRATCQQQRSTLSSLQGTISQGDQSATCYQAEDISPLP